jgi:hypothetical protein
LVAVTQEVGYFEPFPRGEQVEGQQGVGVAGTRCRKLCRRPVLELIEIRPDRQVGCAKAGAVDGELFKIQRFGAGEGSQRHE